MTKKILVVGSVSYAEAIDGLGPITTRTSDFMKNPEEFKLVLFTGGEDVHPSLYNDDSPAGVCWSNLSRDRHEMAIFDRAAKNSITMTGICRGLQFLNVMHGGKMMHDLKGHGGTQHGMKIAHGKVLTVNSLHHQMILPQKNAIVIGITDGRLSKYYVGADDDFVDYHGDEIEAAIFPEIKGFGVQYHPEIMPRSSEGYKYYHDMVKASLSTPWPEFLKRYDKIRVHNNVLTAG